MVLRSVIVGPTNEERQILLDVTRGETLLITDYKLFVINSEGYDVR